MYYILCIDDALRHRCCRLDTSNRQQQFSNNGTGVHSVRVVVFLVALGPQGIFRRALCLAYIYVQRPLFPAFVYMSSCWTARRRRQLGPQ